MHPKQCNFGYKIIDKCYRNQLKVKNLPDLIADGDIDHPLDEKDAAHRRAADRTKATFAEGAPRLDLSPLHDADEAEVVVTAIDPAADRPPGTGKADAARLLFLLRFLHFLGERHVFFSDVPWLRLHLRLALV